MLSTYKQVEKLAADEVQADVDNYWAYTDLVTSRLAMGMYDEANRALEQLLTTTPDDSPYVLEVLADTLTRLADALGTDKSQPVRDAIAHIQAHIEKQAQQAKLQTQQHTPVAASDGDDPAAESAEPVSGD